MIDFFNDAIVPALVLGSIYALGAIGISMLFSILRFAHFAHGDLMTAGAYIALPLTAAGVHPLATIPVAALGTGAIAIATDRLFYRPFRASRPVMMVIASFGVALIIRALLLLIVGTDDAYYWGLQRPIAALDPVRIGAKHLYISAAVIVLISATHVLLAKTRTGKAMRAMSDDANLARISGISTERVVIWTWLVAGALAATAGVLLGMDTRVKFDMGWNAMLPMFAAAILGGLGRPYGAIAGGLVIGSLEELSTLVVPSDYKSAASFAAMVVVLIFRPDGIFRGWSG